MKKKLIAILIVSLNAISNSKAQDDSYSGTNSDTRTVYATKTNKQELSIGDQVPDIEITNIINYKTKTARVSDFRGKLLILDFWATWCSPCVASFPKLDSLQKKFNTKIQILPITYESQKVVESFLSRLKSINRVSTVSVTQDIALKKLFPHTYLPHYIWINESGKVIAITESKDLTEENIAGILNGKQNSFTVKRDTKRNIIYNRYQPTFAPSVETKIENTTELKKIPDSSLLISSTLTRYIEGLAEGFHSYDSSLLCVRNSSISFLYKIALLGNGISIMNRNTFVIDILDTTLRDRIESIKIRKGIESLYWLRENGYCYELKVPSFFTKKQKYDLMLEELNRTFGMLYGIEGVIEQRNSKYLSLERNNTNSTFATKGGIPLKNVDKLSLKIQNQGLNSLLSALAQPLQLQPIIIDETNFSGNIDLELNCQLSDLNAVNTELNKYGLQLTEKEKIMNVALIRTKSK